jgi:hypothetical protein
MSWDDVDLDTSARLAAEEDVRKREAEAQRRRRIAVGTATVEDVAYDIEAELKRVPAGEEREVRGVLVRRTGDVGFQLVHQQGSDVTGMAIIVAAASGCRLAPRY